MGAMEMPLPDNTLPMMTGTGPFGPMEMGGMFSVVKVRDDVKPGDYKDPGWYKHPPGTRGLRVHGPGASSRARARRRRRTPRRSTSASPRRPHRPLNQLRRERSMNTQSCPPGCRWPLVMPRSPSRMATTTQREAPRSTTPARSRTRAFGREGDPAKATRTIRVDMADTMRFTPADITVKRGETVKLVATNKGKVLHEMVLGTTRGAQEARRADEEVSRAWNTTSRTWPT